MESTNPKLKQNTNRIERNVLDFCFLFFVFVFSVCIVSNGAQTACEHEVVHHIHTFGISINQQCSRTTIMDIIVFFACIETSNNERRARSSASSTRTLHTFTDSLNQYQQCTTSNILYIAAPTRSSSS